MVKQKAERSKEFGIANFMKYFLTLIIVLSCSFLTEEKEKFYWVNFRGISIKWKTKYLRSDTTAIKEVLISAYKDSIILNYSYNSFTERFNISRSKKLQSHLYGTSMWSSGTLQKWKDEKFIIGHKSTLVSIFFLNEDVMDGNHRILLHSINWHICVAFEDLARSLNPAIR